MNTGPENINAVAHELAKLGPVLPVNGKAPLWKGWQKRATRTPNGEPEWSRATGVGLLTGERAGFFVFDVDPKAGGEEALAALEAKHGALPATLTAMTGGGGLHFYFRWPGFAVGNSASKLGKGLDVKGNNGQVIGPGSRHASGAVYAWAPERGPGEAKLAEAPPWLIEKLRTSAKPKPRAPVGALGTSPIDPAIVERARKYVEGMPGGIQGTPGSKQTFDAALALTRGYSLPEPIALEILREVHNPKCKPPWSEKELKHKIRSAIEKGRKPFGFLLEPCHTTDTGNAIRFKRRQIDAARYCHALGEWYLWDGKRWAPDATGRVDQLGKDTVFAIALEEAREEEDDARRQLLTKWSYQSQNAPRRRAMIDLARSELPVPPYELDRDPWLLNVENGTIDLRTGKLREHRREDFITKLSPITFDPKARCPLWMETLKKAQPKAGVVDFLQRLFGMALTGDVAEEKFPIMQGAGDDFKSTVLNTIQAILGGYAVTVQSGLVLSADRNADPERATPELMKLRGARLAVVYETAVGVIVDDAKIKRVASTDTIAARGLFKESSEFLPTHKVILVTNHKPINRARDNGTWRRIILIKFEVKVPEAERDIHFKERLRPEYPGILAWMVQGCLLWQKEGRLIIPQTIQDATKEYQQAEDVLGQFVTDRLVLSPQASASKGGVYGDYQNWASGNGIHQPLTMPAFNKQIADLQGVRDARTETARLWIGLGLKHPVKGQTPAQEQAERMAQVTGSEPQAGRPDDAVPRRRRQRSKRRRS